MTKYKQNYMTANGFSEGDFIPCEVCGKEAVDIHHIQFRGMGGNTEMDNAENLIALCRSDHDNAEAGLISKETLLKIKGE